VSREHFKGKLPDCKIVLAELPKVKHRAFSVVTSNLRLIVINTARSKTLEEQKADLRHEIIHMAGVKGPRDALPSIR
jgi:Zn-dependent peptidase ImmA (M78 family)